METTSIEGWSASELGGNRRFVGLVGLKIRGAQRLCELQVSARCIWESGLRNMVGLGIKDTESHQVSKF